VYAERGTRHARQLLNGGAGRSIHLTSIEVEQNCAHFAGHRQQNSQHEAATERRRQSKYRWSSGGRKHAASRVSAPETTPLLAEHHRIVCRRN